MGRICKIVLVCEGWRDSALARGFLSAAGVDGRLIDTRTNPGGSGHDWVMSQFVGEVANLSRFNEGRGVLALLDEDGQGTLAREAKVANLLKARQLGLIDASEGRCLLLPARNLETWLYWLTAHKSGVLVMIDEIADYKKSVPPGLNRIDDKDCRPAGEWLHTLNHTQMPPGCPPMLASALKNLRGFLERVRR